MLNNSVLNDHDEEVRERARYYLICLKEIESEEKVIYDCIDPLKIIENPININDIDILEQYIHVINILFISLFL